MPAQGVSMHKIKEILRLYHEVKLSQHQIARSLSLSSGAVNKYLALAKAAYVEWPLPTALSELELRALLRPHADKVRHYHEPDYASIHQELKSKGVTLLLLWQEYEQTHGKKAYRYAQFCAKYRDWLDKQKPCMRQKHLAGEKLFIDYCGPTLDIIDPDTGEIRRAAIFVAVLGASNYTYAEATWDQTLPNFIASHVRTFEFLGGVPMLLVPDNLKAAVTKACRYEPKINATYEDLAQHYGTAILPTRPYRPKDKAKVENAVLVVERWILAKLRHHTFVGLSELNQAIKKLLHQLNHRPFKQLPGTRASQFAAIDKPALKLLPKDTYTFATFKEARVHLDYHVQVEDHYYSVPHALIKALLAVRITYATIECFYQGQRVASHRRSYQKGGYTTLTEHMPRGHQRYADKSPAKFLKWASDIGPYAKQVVEAMLSQLVHPEQSYRACLGLLNATKPYGKERLESACQRAITIGSPKRASVLSILKRGLDKQPLIAATKTARILQHENIRGSEHYAQQLNSSY